MLALYRLLGRLGWPAIRLYLAVRLRRGKEDPARFGERLGRASRPRPEGPLVWLHGASIGEALSLLALTEKILAACPDAHALLTTGTVTSARLMADRLPARAFHQYVPVDTPRCVERFLTHWHPDLVLWAESEFWPTLVSETQKLRAPMILVNGRISRDSFERWQRHPGLIKRLLGEFALVLGQTDTDCERFFRLGATHTRAVGNLKFAAAPLPVDKDALETLQQAVKDRPRWLAASTHPGEEMIAARVHQSLKAKHPGLLTLIAPRHPTRTDDIMKDFGETGLSVAIRSRNETISETTDIYLADTVGDMGLFYRLCDVAFLGKSLSGTGGQNPIEAAHLKTALLSGPHVTNFEDVIATLKRAGALEIVETETDLSQAVDTLLTHKDQRHHRMEAAHTATAQESGVLDHLMAELAPHLEVLKPKQTGGRP